MAIGKWFIPRNVRRVAHPVGYAKRRVTPKPVRTVMQLRHPLGTASSAATLAVCRLQEGTRAIDEGAIDNERQGTNNVCPG